MAAGYTVGKPPNQARSSTSTHSNLWDLTYSLNGSTWVTLVNDYAVATGYAWTHLSYDLSAVAAMEDQTWVTFRLVEDGAAHSNSVNVWVDDFQVSGSLIIPEPGAMALLGVGLGLLALRRRRRRT